MKTIADLIARVKELDKNATRGPWHLGVSYKCSVVNEAGDYFVASTLETDSPEGMKIRGKNAALIAEARQLMPALAEMLEECMKQRESCQFLLRTGTVYRSVDVDSHKLNSKLLEIAKKHGLCREDEAIEGAK